jgi:signal transduction histidine kinase
LRSSEDRLRKLNERLEALVSERTAELSTAIKALQTLVNRLRTTLQTSFIFQGYVGADGALLEANAESLAGIEARAEAVLGKPFWETPWFTATPGMPQAVQEAVATVLRGESFRHRIDVVLPAGLRTFDFSMRPVKDEQEAVIGIVAEGVDLTPLLQAEERLRQSQKMEAIGQLTGGIAHDFNNLLTGIIGSLDMMQRRVSQGRYERLGDYAKAALASANRAAALTHRLLAFARRQPLDPKPVDANALIGEMQDMLRRTLGERIRLDVLAAGALWLTRCDPNQLDSAILNLAINARDAMPSGGRITIETSNVEVRASDAIQLNPGQYVCISVQDTGVGMSADVIAKAFDPFFTTKPLGQGTGLGLSMTYGFVRQSGGDVTIKSIPGEGTAIRLYLPRFAGETEHAQTSVSETGSYRALGRRTVLVVEDDEVVRRLILDVLADLGFDVIEALDGKAGLDSLLSDARIDLLITDVGLPKLNGRQMVDLAKERRPRLRTLFITGYAEADANIENLGPRTTLMTKPFPMEALAQRIHEIMAR